MKQLYLDCAMGAAGDMISAALLGLTEDPIKALAELNGIGIPHVVYEAEESVKCGIRGLHMTVHINGEEEDEHHHTHHHHRGMAEISEIINGLNLSEKVKNDILAVYELIAEAESKVHGEPVTQIHFHELGMMDAIGDIAAVCCLLDKLSPEKITASAVHVGSGTVKCAHGVLPVPAPAAAELLKGIPIYGGEIRGELCTPTGAALLKYFVHEFGAMPEMKVSAIGYGMGKKDFSSPNCIRAMMGETEGDTVCELLCNLDDMTGEEIAFAMEEILSAGALDVYTLPIGMKKSRPAVMLCVMCRREDRERMMEEIFRHTTTLGIREKICERVVLERESETVETQFGPVRRKIARGYGTERRKYEYEDLAAIARREGMSLREVKEKMEK